jgi:hypothetical protein
MNRVFSTLIALAAWFAPPPAEAAKVKGTVKRKAFEHRDVTLGYTVTQIAARSKRLEARRQDVVLFLKVNTSLTLPEPSIFEMHLRGMELHPEISVCSVDAKVSLVNEELRPVTIVVGGTEVSLGAGERKEYVCGGITGGGHEDLREVRVKEWPYVRGNIFVGEVGVFGTLREDGGFELEAPKGEYVLQVVGRDGVLAAKDVEVKADVDVGAIDLRPENEREPEPAAPPPPPPRRAPRPAPPPEEEEGEVEEAP